MVGFYKHIILLLSFCSLLFSSCESHNGDKEKGILSDDCFFSIMESGEFEGYIFKYREFNSAEALAKFKTFDEMVAAMKIPDDSLKILTVEGLAWSNMFWGLNGMYKAYGGLETTEIDGVDIMTGLNNGWVKLQENMEGAAYLLKIWQNMEVPRNFDFDQFSLDPKDKCSTIDQGMMPLLLSLDKFNWSLSDEAFRCMAHIAFEKIEKQSSLPDTYSYSTIKYNYVALAAVALKLAVLSEEQRQELQYFVAMSGGVDDVEIQHLIDLVGKAAGSVL